MKKRTLLIFLIIIAIFTFNTNLFAGPGGGTFPKANSIIITDIDTDIANTVGNNKSTP